MTDNLPTPAVRPLFLLSLPRAGSTLVQRVLAAHPEISTTAEPWIVLPLVYARRAEGIRAEYSQQLAAFALWDFANALEGGPATFDLRLRTFVQDLYADAAEEGARYFLDKTPHYLNVADDLLRLFPDARFVFLWRSPVAVLASLLKNFRDGQFEPYAFPGELFRGPSALASAFHANRDRAHAVRFEDLVGENREAHWRGIFDYLELDWDPQVLERFSTLELRGRFGDPTGRAIYSDLSAEPLEKWKENLRGPIRQAWVKRWLRRMGRAPLEIMGYDLDRLIVDVQTAGPARVYEVGIDALALLESSASGLFRKRVLEVQDFPPLSLLTKLIRRVRRLRRS
jgi:Sulfotransferase family